MWSDYHLTAVVQTIFKELFSVFITKTWLSCIILSYHVSELWYTNSRGIGLPQSHTTSRQGSTKHMSCIGKLIWVQILVQFLTDDRNWGKSHSFGESHIIYPQIWVIVYIVEFCWILKNIMYIYMRIYVCYIWAYIQIYVYTSKYIYKHILMPYTYILIYMHYTNKWH